MTGGRDIGETQLIAQHEIQPAAIEPRPADDGLSLVRHGASAVGRWSAVYGLPAMSVAVHWPPNGSVTGQESPTLRGCEELQTGFKLASGAGSVWV